jgi:hypothetical protein
LLCFAIHSGSTVLPNGTLLSVVDKADSPEHFIVWSKLRNGQYVGVTPAKSEAFLHFAHDVTYWTRHATPDVRDLGSTTGKLFRFSVEYPAAVGNLVTSRLAKFKNTEALSKLQEVFQAKQQSFEALKKEARTSHTNPLVLKTLLEVEIQELTAQGQAMAALAASSEKLDGEILDNSNTLVALEALLEDILTTLKRHDPDLASLDVDALLAAFRKSDETLRTGDRQQLEALRALKAPHVAGAGAQESVDKLYRDRFESLPQSFADPRRQALP